MAESRSRPGTLVYEDSTTRRRYGSLAQVWRAHRQRQETGVNSASGQKEAINSAQPAQPGGDQDDSQQHQPDPRIVGPCTAPCPVEFPFLEAEGSGRPGSADSGPIRKSTFGEPGSSIAPLRQDLE